MRLVRLPAVLRVALRWQGETASSTVRISFLCSAGSDPTMERDRDTSMDTTSDAATARPTTVAFVNLFDATTFGRTVRLTPDEERRLRNVLTALRDYGFILEASFEPVVPG